MLHSSCTFQLTVVRSSKNIQSQSLICTCVVPSKFTGSFECSLPDWLHIVYCTAITKNLSFARKKNNLTPLLAISSSAMSSIVNCQRRHDIINISSSSKKPRSKSICEWFYLSCMIVMTTDGHPRFVLVGDDRSKQFAARTFLGTRSVGETTLWYTIPEYV